MKTVTAICVVLITILLAVYVVPRTEFYAHWQLQKAAARLGLPYPSTATDYARVRNYSDVVRPVEEAGHSLNKQVLRTAWDKFTPVVSAPAVDREEALKMERESLEFGISLALMDLQKKENQK